MDGKPLYGVSSLDGALIGWFGEELHVDDETEIAPEAAREDAAVGLKVVNGDRLTVQLCCRLPAKITGYENLDGSAKPDLTLTIIGLSSGAKAVITPSSVTKEKSGDRYEFRTETMILDGLIPARDRHDPPIPSERFRDLATRLDADMTGTFRPGEDIHLTASAVYGGKDVVPGEFGDYVGNQTVNSLFERLTYSPAETYADSYDLAVVSNVRHLQNLEVNVSGVQPQGATLRALQVEDIDFSQGWAELYDPVISFLTVTNPKLTDYYNETEIDGTVKTSYILHSADLGIRSCIGYNVSTPFFLYRDGDY